MSAPLDRLAAALADRYAVKRELGAGGMATVIDVPASRSRCACLTISTWLL